MIIIFVSSRWSDALHRAPDKIMRMPNAQFYWRVLCGNPHALIMFITPPVFVRYFKCNFIFNRLAREFKNVLSTMIITVES